VIGAVDLLAPSLQLSPFSLEGERTITAAFSSALLLGAGALAFLLSSAEGGRSMGGAVLWRFMGAFFWFMALDELFAIHEKVSAPVTGMSWQITYAPIVVSAVIAWTVIWRKLPSRAASSMWLAGAAAWFVSQVIESVQWDGDRLVYEWTFVPEEMLEMTGSLLWGLALLVTLRLVVQGDATVEGETTAEPATDFRLRKPRRRRARGTERAGERPGVTTGRPPDAR
jgi:hypothetical protein